MIALQMLLMGTPVLYYGEEIDQPHIDLQKRDIVDPPGKVFIHSTKEGMVLEHLMNWGDQSWLSPKPWLPLCGKRTVKSSRDAKDSVLNWCRCLIKLRRQHSVLRLGDIQWDGNGFWRTDSQSRWYIVLNWSNKAVSLPPVVYDQSPKLGLLTENERGIQPFGVAIFFNVLILDRILNQHN